MKKIPHNSFMEKIADKLETQKPQHTSTCKKANRKQTQFDMDCGECNEDSYKAITAMRPTAIKAGFGVHTPTPWSHLGGERDSEFDYIYGADREFILEIDASKNPKDAAFIVRAVNCHEELLSLLKNINEFLSEGMSLSPNALIDDCEEAETFAQAVKQAIAKAEAK